MKTFKNFDINNGTHVSNLAYALHVAQNDTLENAINYLEERFEVAPLKALQALYLNSGNFELTPIQQQYVDAYFEAESKFIDALHEKPDNINDSEDESKWTNEDICPNPVTLRDIID